MILYWPWLKRDLSCLLFCLFLQSVKVSEDGHWRWLLNYDLTKNEEGMHISERQRFPPPIDQQKLGGSKLSRFEERKTCSVNTYEWTKTGGGMNSEVWTHHADILINARSLDCILWGMGRQWIMWSELCKWGAWLCSLLGILVSKCWSKRMPAKLSSSYVRNSGERLNQDINLRNPLHINAI